MKLIKAIIKPFRLQHVKAALSELGIEGMTIADGKGFGRQKGHPEVYRGSEYTIEFVPKILIYLAVEDARASAAAKAIIKAAKTGKIGDGKIFIQPIEAAVRIRTGESGDKAI